MLLLERSEPRGELRGAVDALVGGRSRVVLLHGEAGIGKTSLVQDFLEALPGGLRTLSGGCDDLLAPRPLGAVLELLDDVPGHRIDLTGHAGRQVYEVLGAEPTVCVVEDVHWADEATLDVLTYLARRIALIPLLLVLTFRDDELPADHPLRRTLAAAPPAHSRRIGLAPLSLDAVRRLAGPGADAEAVHRVAGGNPFLVSELLVGDGGDAPASVRDAVLGRYGRLGADARATAELVSVVPGRAEAWLIEDCLGASADVESCEAQGLLVTDRDGVRFRHELARRVIEDALPGLRRREHNAVVLRALAAASAPDARLAHHAWQAGDADALVRYGLRAAARAAESRSHREAADLYVLVLRHDERLTPQHRADAWDACSTEAYAAGRNGVAASARERALALRRELGDPRRTSDTLRWLSRVRWTSGDRIGAEAAADEALAILTDGDVDEPASRELAMALSNKSQLAMLAQRDDEAIRLGRRAAQLAEAVGDRETVVNAQVNIGSTLVRTDLDAGLALLERTAREAAEQGYDDPAGRALINAAWTAMDQHRLPTVERLIGQAMTLAEDGEWSLYLGYLQVMRAQLELARGDLAAARAALDQAPDAHPAPALVARATIAVRRGDAEAEALLEQGWRVAVSTAELQRLRPMACIRAEWAWLHADPAAVDEATRDTYAIALDRGTPWDVGPLALWRRRGGVLDRVPDGLPEPYALELAGRAAAAADAWQRLGEPHSRALALLGSDRPEDVLQAIEILDRTGALAAVPLARGRLRALGVASVPRGRARTTRGNPAGLTDRQLDVLRLVGQGLTNREIAGRLVLSSKTVEHHVGAVFAKLGVTSRAEAAAAARVLGLEGPA